MEGGRILTGGLSGGRAQRDSAAPNRLTKERTGHNPTELVTIATQAVVTPLSAVRDDRTTLVAPRDANNRSEAAPLKPSVPVIEDGCGKEILGFTSTETMKAYQGRGSWGVGNFICNTYSLHCNHQNDSALRWAVV